MSEKRNVFYLPKLCMLLIHNILTKLVKNMELEYIVL